MKFLNHILSLTLIALFAACGAPESKTADNTGEVPRNVVVLDLGSLETLDRLGIPIAGTAKRNLPDYLEKYKNDDSIVDVGTLKEVNFETISRLNPDLIILSSRLRDSQDELSQIAPTLYLQVDYKNYMQSFEENVRKLAEVFGKEQEAEQALKETNEKIAQTREQIAGLEGKGLVVLYNNGKFSAYGKGSRFGFIHDVLGVKEAREDVEVSDHGFAISNEFIQEANPDYLFVIDRGAVVNGKGAAKEEIENPLIQQTKAFRNKKIIYLDPNIWYISGAGLISVNEMADDVLEAVQP